MNLFVGPDARAFTLRRQCDQLAYARIRYVTTQRPLFAAFS
jgi:hypothetical protein